MTDGLEAPPRPVIAPSPGVWEPALRFGGLDEMTAEVAGLEGLGFSSVWIPDVGGDLFGTIGAFLGATKHITVGSAILNIWMHDAADSAAQYHELEAAYPGRILVGVGVSHQPVIDMLTQSGRFNRPLAALNKFLDEVDGLGPGAIPVDKRLVGALGPRALEITRERSGGALPYLVTPRYTAVVRERLGPDKLLYVQQAVVLSKDKDQVRATARNNNLPLDLPNYVNSWRRMGFTEDDVRLPGSDRLVDELVVSGGGDEIGARMKEHLEAGADNVLLQVYVDRPDMSVFPKTEYRELALALGM